MIMTLITGTQSKDSPCYSPLPSPSGTHGLLTCTQTAIKAYSHGLVNHYYFDNGRKQSLKDERDFRRVIDSGFALQQVEGTFYLTRGLPGGAQPVERDLDNKPPTQKSVFISYCHEQKEIALKIDLEFQKAGFLVIRDEKYLQATDDLREFMNVITHRNLDHVVVIASDDYLKRPNCMYEVNLIMKSHKFQDSLLTYVMTDIENPQKYMDHWNASANIKDDCRKFIENVRSNPHLKDSDLRANGYKTLVDTINTSKPTRAISPVETKLLR